MKLSPLAHCVHGLTADLSLFLNHNLKIPAKYAVLEPHNRKKKGKPTEKRIAALCAAEEDARLFVDKASPKVPDMP